MYYQYKVDLWSSEWEGRSQHETSSSVEVDENKAQHVVQANQEGVAAR